MRLIKFASLSLLLAVAAGASAQSNNTSSAQQKFDNSSDHSKGVQQTQAPAKGNVYANPGRQKALNDAFNDGAKPTPSATPKSGSSVRK